MGCGPDGSCPSLIVLSMVRTEETTVFLRQKTQVRAFEPRDRAARSGVLGSRGGAEWRSGESGEATTSTIKDSGLFIALFGILRATLACQHRIGKGDRH